jgi:hypothetical protein
MGCYGQAGNWKSRAARAIRSEREVMRLTFLREPKTGGKQKKKFGLFSCVESKAVYSPAPKWRRWWDCDRPSRAARCCHNPLLFP